MFNKRKVEEYTLAIREVLGIEPNLILTPDHLEELIQKIEKTQEIDGINNFKIVNENVDGVSKLFLDNGNNFTIQLFGSKEEKFENLMEIFAFVWCLDKKALTQYQLKHCGWEFPRYLEEIEHYFMRSFILPEEVFRMAMIPYMDAIGETVRIEDMCKEVSKYSWARAIDLHILQR